MGQFLDRFHAGIVETLDDLNVPSHTAPGTKPPGVWGRTGQLAAVGVAVRHWITYYDAYLNVCPPMGLFRLVESDSHGQTKMSSMVAERCGPVRMTAVRAALTEVTLADMAEDVAGFGLPPRAATQSAVRELGVK